MSGKSRWTSPFKIPFFTGCFCLGWQHLCNSSARTAPPSSPLLCLSLLSPSSSSSYHQFRHLCGCQHILQGSFHLIIRLLTFIIITVFMIITIIMMFIIVMCKYFNEGRHFNVIIYRYLPTRTIAPY